MNRVEQTIRNGSELYVRATIALEEYLSAQHELLDDLRGQLARNKASQPAGNGQELLNGTIQLRVEAIDGAEQVLDMLRAADLITFTTEDG